MIVVNVVCPSVCMLPAEELLSLLGSGLVGMADEDLDDALGSGGSGRVQASGEEGEESGGGRESRVSLYEFSNPLVQVSSAYGQSMETLVGCRVINIG